MTKTFVIADTHFGHRNVIKFEDSNGEIIRKFDTIEDHDEHLVERWNSVVGEHDRVYHLGDVVINRKALAILERLNGKKVLIKGNHDIFKLKDYLPHFEDIRAYKVLPKEGMILSHIPIHPDCLNRQKVNIHGHLHQKRVTRSCTLECGVGEYIEEIDDPKYRCVSVDQTNYTPVDLQSLINEYKEKDNAIFI